MKANIHPKWYPAAKISCACGKVFYAGSTKPEIQVEVCSACHPFFTGEERFVDTLGRVERFEQRRAAATLTKSKTKVKETAKTLEEIRREIVKNE